MKNVALITGGASGIGEALAKTIAMRGTTVVVADRQANRANEVCRKIRENGGSARWQELDVRDADAFDKLVAATFDTEGRLDYFFNNAGIAIGMEARRMGIDDWNEIIDVNLRGVTNGVQAVYPRMIRQGFGHIINTASLAGLTVGPMMAGYTTTKHAVVGLSQALRAEAALEGIKVSALCPGVVRTAILERGGKYGRVVGIGPEQERELWKMLRPMDADKFAIKVLRQVDRNKGIIVVPGSWKVSWLLARISPELSVRMGRMMHKEALRRMEAETD